MPQGEVIVWKWHPNPCHTHLAWGRIQGMLGKDTRGADRGVQGDGYIVRLRGRVHMLLWEDTYSSSFTVYNSSSLYIVDQNSWEKSVIHVRDTSFVTTISVISACEWWVNKKSKFCVDESFITVVCWIKEKLGGWCVHVKNVRRNLRVQNVCGFDFQSDKLI